MLFANWQPLCPNLDVLLYQKASQQTHTPEQDVFLPTHKGCKDYPTCSVWRLVKDYYTCTQPKPKQISFNRKPVGTSIRKGSIQTAKLKPFMIAYFF